MWYVSFYISLCRTCVGTLKLGNNVFKQFNEHELTPSSLKSHSFVFSLSLSRVAREQACFPQATQYPFLQMSVQGFKLGLATKRYQDCKTIINNVVGS